MEIKHDIHLRRLVNSRHNGMVKVVFVSAIATSIVCLIVKKIMTILIKKHTLFTVFEFDIIKNKGFFLGLWNDNHVFVKIIMVALFLLFSYMLFKTSKAYPKISHVYVLAPWLLFAGMTGNMAEMLLYGSVTDYIAIRLPLVKIFFFNIEDCLMQAGAILFAYQSIFHNSTLDKIYNL